MDLDFTGSGSWRDVWPVFAIAIRTPTLVLRPLNPGDVVAVADLAVRGIHDPSTMPFEIPWTDADPPTLRRAAFQWWSSAWAGWSPAAWRLAFVVLDDDEPIGVQDIAATQFPELGTCVTGSWLGRAHQGQGFGKEMRAAVLHFAFAGLGARQADTGAWWDNAASLGVTRSLGYAPDGTGWKLRRGLADRHLRFTMDRAAWDQRRRADIEVDGLDERCLAMFGL